MNFSSNCFHSFLLSKGPGFTAKAVVNTWSWRALWMLERTKAHCDWAFKICSVSPTMDGICETREKSLFQWISVFRSFVLLVPNIILPSVCVRNANLLDILVMSFPVSTRMSENPENTSSTIALIFCWPRNPIQWTSAWWNSFHWFLQEPLLFQPRRLGVELVVEEESHSWCDFSWRAAVTSDASIRTCLIKSCTKAGKNLTIFFHLLN